jgi:hypothetical protein
MTRTSCRATKSAAAAGKTPPTARPEAPRSRKLRAHQDWQRILARRSLRFF